MGLPQFQFSASNLIQTLMLMQTQWRSKLNPLLANPLFGGVFLNDVALIDGVTVINHTLARQQQGWVMSDVNGAATIYRSAPFNDATLSLTSSAAVTVNLFVF